MSEQLPLFPLHAVLFPGTNFPLQVFEERYKLLVNRCLEEQSVFGVVLIKSGSEVGEPAVPYGVGTTARIVEAQPQQNGQIALIVLGERRFHIQEVIQEQPYLVANIEWLDDLEAEEEIPNDVVERARDAFRAYLKRVLMSNGEWVREINVPGHAGELSFSIASVLQIDLRDKQEWLETDSTVQRLTQESAVLEEETRNLEVTIRLRALREGFYAKN